MGPMYRGSFGRIFILPQDSQHPRRIKDKMAGKEQEMNFKELRDSMDQLLDKVSSSKTSKTITRDKYDAIVQHLTDPKI